jgi:hypothetical protein
MCHQGKEKQSSFLFWVLSTYAIIIAIILTSFETTHLINTPITKTYVVARDELSTLLLPTLPSS